MCCKEKRNMNKPELVNIQIARVSLDFFSRMTTLTRLEKGSEIFTKNRIGGFTHNKKTKILLKIYVTMITFRKRYF